MVTFQVSVVPSTTIYCNTDNYSSIIAVHLYQYIIFNVQF